MSKTHSLWLTTPAKDTYPSLKRDEQTEVIIIGAGIHGLTAAYILAKAGKKVTVLEKNTIGSGETGYTTAFISYVIDADLQTLTKHFDEKEAQNVWQSCKDGISFIETVIQEEKIECDFKRVPLTLYTTKKEGISYLKEESALAQKLHFSLKFSEEKIKGIESLAAVEACCHAVFHPLKYLHGLAAAAQKYGAVIYENTEVTEIKEGDEPTVTTKEARVTAKALITATHAPISSKLLVQIKLTPYNTYVLAGTIPTDQIKEGLYIDTEEPYHYLRVEKGQDKDRVIFGGNDHETGMEKNTNACFKDLNTYLLKHISSDFVEEYRWSGQVFESTDGLPYIGRHPLHKNMYLGTGFAGDGMPFGTLSGIINAQLILQETKEKMVESPLTVQLSHLEELFKPKRTKGLGSLLKQGLTYPVEMVKDHLLDTSNTELEKILAGEGGIIERNGKKFAVYKDENGTITKLSAICTHLACVVHWNNAEKTWDCPCHGSRFSNTGEVISGPATKPLEKS